MENEKTDLSPFTEGQDVVHTSQQAEEKSISQSLPVKSIGQNSLVKSLQEFDQFAEVIIKSDYAKGFKRVIKNKETGKDEEVVLKEDIIACLMVGQELGIKPMGCLALGNKLNVKSYFSVLKGRELGLDPITSISKIYNIETSQGTVLSLAVDIINKVILENSKKVELIRDFELVPLYYTVVGNVYVGHKYNILDINGILKENYFIYLNSTPVEEVEANKHKIVIRPIGFTHISSLRITTDTKDVIYHYSLQEAIDAGLYRGFHSSLKDDKGNPIYVPGRDNWNKHNSTMLRNRVTSIAGRDSFPHKLHGSYTPEEVSEFADAIVIE